MEQKFLPPRAVCTINTTMVARRVWYFRVAGFIVPSVNVAIVVALLYVATGGGVLFLAGVGSIVFLTITTAVFAHFSDPRSEYRFLAPMAPLIEVTENASAPFGPIALEWSRRCRAYGMTRSMTFANPLHETLFASTCWGSPPVAVLFLPSAATVACFTADERSAIIEHEAAHLRLSRPFSRAIRELLCFPSDLLLRGIRTIRIACIRYGRRRAAQNVHYCERMVFWTTYRFISRTEEYAADALAADTSKTPYAMIAALETFRALIDEPPQREEDELCRLVHILERMLQHKARSLVEKYDRHLMRHPTFEERRRALLALCR